MPAQLTFPHYLAALHDAVQHLARQAARSGLDVPVPSCPEWTVRRLIGHQGAVHRWAAGSFDGADLEWGPVEKAGRSHDDPVEWLRDGAIALVKRLVDAPDDAEAPTFLHDAPPPRLFWARRQCHETTIHAVDVLAAALGRLPRAEETWVAPDVALDGVDELLLGFVPRSRSPLRSATPVTLVVRPTDADVSWLVRVSTDPPVSTRHDGPGPDAADGDLVVEGTATQLYLWLWHRSDELDRSAADATGLWREMVVT